EELSTGPVLETIEDVTEQAAEQVAAIGDREAQIEAVIARAQSQIGVPYAWGGGNANGPTRGIRDGGVADSFGDFNKIGFDCSGLVLYAFAGAGIALPHYTGYQYNHGTKIDPSQMQRGDLIFYGPGGSHHVAIYLGDGTMIEAPNSGSTVKISPVRWSGMSPHAVRLI
ncbi:MAG TPA: NlpC/P60 family protein, partial [Corynebacterium pollutisoli]|nr:NlpC/P60 family protein [Corynebacterium pollutisoli]